MSRRTIWATAFYRRVFDYELEALPAAPDVEMYAFPWQPGAPNSAGALVRGERFVPSREGSRVYFQCDDVAVQEARATEAGGQVVVPKMSIGEWGFIAMVQDTEGNIMPALSEIDAAASHHGSCCGRGPGTGHSRA